jgi:hypothetical protein
MNQALREATKIRIGVLNQRQADLIPEKDGLSEELRNFSHGEHPTANPKINVLASLRERVTISLGETKEKISTEIPGPISIIENSRDGGLRLVTYAPLKVSAEEAEKSAMAEAEAGDKADS